MAKYAFGDSGLAAARLRLLADVFHPASRSFLQSFPPTARMLTVDLGCGPGYTTQLLADVLSAEQTVGLDNSPSFLDIALKTETERVRFLEHDVTTVPFPVGPADLVYGRMILTHLARPTAMVSAWASQLGPEGLLVLEEVDSIETEHPVFSLYSQIVAEMLRSQGHELYIGPELERFCLTAGLCSQTNRVARLSVSNRDAAAMFHLNLQVWRSNEFVRKQYPNELIEGLDHDLRQLKEAASGTDITWAMRQVAFRQPKRITVIPGPARIPGDSCA